MSRDLNNPFRADPKWDEPTARLWQAIVSYGGPQLVIAAIADGARVDAINPRGVSMTLAAVHYDTPDHQIISALLDAGAPLFEADGRSPAMDAAKRFLDNGATRRFLEARALALQEREDLEQSIESAPARPAPRV